MFIMLIYTLGKVFKADLDGYNYTMLGALELCIFDSMIFLLILGKIFH